MGGAAKILSVLKAARDLYNWKNVIWKVETRVK